MRLASKRIMNNSFEPELVIYVTDNSECSVSFSIEGLMQAKAMLPGPDFKQAIDEALCNAVNTLEQKNSPLTQEEISFIKMVLEN